MNELRLKIVELLNELEEEAENRYMNDIEYSRYDTLIEILDLIDEM